MTRPASLAWVAAAAVAVGGGCRTAPPAPPAPNAPAQGRELTAAVVPFAALYRVDCCRQRGVLVTLRCGAAGMAATVVVPPAGPRGEAWWGRDGAWLRRAGAECRDDLGAALREFAGIRPETIAAFLAGHLPADAAIEGDRGLAGGRDGLLEWTVAFSGSPPRLNGLMVRDASGEPVANIDVAEHRGHVPGVIRGVVAAERFTATLVEWRGAPQPVAPAWLAAQPCAERE